MHGRDFTAGAIRFQARYLRTSKQGHIIVSQRRHDTADVRIGFGVNQARKAVASIATDAWTFLRIFLIQHDAEWSMKWLQPVQRKVVAQLLNARFVADRWVWECSTAVRLSRIFADRAMHMINLLRLSVIWLEFIVRNRPGGGRGGGVFRAAKIFVAQTENSCTIEIRVAAHVGNRVRMQLRPARVPPKLLRAVFSL